MKSKRAIVEEQEKGREQGRIISDGVHYISKNGVHCGGGGAES